MDDRLLEDLDRSNLHGDLHVYQFWTCRLHSLLVITHFLWTPNHRHSLIKQSIIESLNANKIPGQDYDFQIEELYFICCQVSGHRVTDLTYYLDLTDIRCQSEQLLNKNFAQHHLNISPSTNAITVAFQDTRVQNNTNCIHRSNLDHLPTWMIR